MPDSYVNKVKDINDSTYNIQDARITNIPVQISAFPQSNSAIVTATTEGSFSTIEFSNAQTTFLRNDGSWAIPPSNLVNLYGVCDTSADTINKIVQINDVTSLSEGLTINVKFTYTNTAVNPKLKINNFDAKDIVFYSNASGFNYNWLAGQVIQFVYDGTQFIQQDSLAYNVFEQYTSTFAPSCAILTANNATAQNATTPIYKNSVCTINHSTGTINASIFSATTNMTIGGKIVATQEYVMSKILSAINSTSY